MILHMPTIVQREVNAEGTRVQILRFKPTSEEEA
jgi:hypothetical protein